MTDTEMLDYLQDSATWTDYDIETGTYHLFKVRLVGKDVPGLPINLRKAIQAAIRAQLAKKKEGR